MLFGCKSYTGVAQAVALGGMNLWKLEMLFGASGAQLEPVSGRSGRLDL